MPPHLSVEDAAAALRRGGVLACPTEAVWGLSCDPFDEAAVMRLLATKQRPVDKGLILAASALLQLDGLVDWEALAPARCNAVIDSWPGPHTWVVPASPRVPRWITGAHDGVAVRISAHPLLAALCAAFGGVLVSTSANPAGAPPPQALEAFDPALLATLDGVVPGATGGLARPTTIRDARSGLELRA
ncbi:MAG TPA: Sua5/YciO/YrdC/YwlC family protein [Luteimonas sp.]|nr:Sua5/YciO/YrdC/YwlC family protein [Luteimonas sp.]